MSDSTKEGIKYKWLGGRWNVALVPVAIIGVILLYREGPMSVDERAIEEVNTEAQGSIFPANTNSGAYLAARFAQQNNDYEEAADYMQQVLAFDPKSRAIQRDAIQRLIIAGDVEKAINLAVASVGGEELRSNDALYTLLFMLKYVDADNYHDALTQVQEFDGQGLLGAVQFLVESWLTLGAERTVNAQAMEKAIENAGLFSPLMQYHAALMYVQMDDDASATEYFANATASIESTPLRVVTQALYFYKKTGNANAAELLANAYKKAYPYSQFLDVWNKEGEQPVANAAEGMAELFFTIASIVFSERSGDDGLMYIQLANYLRPDFPAAKLMQGNMLEAGEHFDDAIAAYQSIDTKSVYYPRAMIRIALNYEAQDKIDKALSTLRNLKKNFPDYIEVRRTYADILRSDKRYIKAADAYSVVIDAHKKNDTQDWRLYYARGICYEREKQWNKAEKDFLYALELEPEQPDVLNYLGYSWVEQGVHIDRARTYILSAVKQRPEDAHIIDSMGWVYYKLGEFDMAVTYLERAISLAPQDPILNDHLGDAYFRVGRTVEATFQWERALNFKPDSEQETLIHEKLEAGGLPPFVSIVIDTADTADIADTVAEDKEPATKVQ